MKTCFLFITKTLMFVLKYYLIFHMWKLMQNKHIRYLFSTVSKSSFLLAFVLNVPEKLFGICFTVLCMTFFRLSVQILKISVQIYFRYLITFTNVRDFSEKNVNFLKLLDFVRRLPSLCSWCCCCKSGVCWDVVFVLWT